MYYLFILFMYMDEEINYRINKRNIPNNEQFKPMFDYRPTTTKYSDFKIPIETTTKTTTDPSPHHSRVDLESQLRNQYMALQRDSQAFYVPTSQSDLYKHPMEYNKEYTSYTQDPQFKRTLCKTLDPNTFHNSTRYYLKKET